MYAARKIIFAFYIIAVLHSIITSLGCLEQSFIPVFSKDVAIDGKILRISFGFTSSKDGGKREAAAFTGKMEIGRFFF